VYAGDSHPSIAPTKLDFIRTWDFLGPREDFIASSENRVKYLAEGKIFDVEMLKNNSISLVSSSFKN